MGLHDLFGYLQHKLWSKERSGVKMSIRLWTTKVKNCLELQACKWHATYFQKNFNKYYNFALNLASIEGLHNKLWASNVVKVLISGISRLTTWESREK